MPGVELGLGIAGLVGVVDTCIKRGRDLREKIKAFRDVDDRLKSLVDRAETTWSAIEALTRVMKGSADCLDERNLKLQESALNRLQNELGDVNSEMERLKPPYAPLSNSTKISMKVRFKYTFKESGLKNDIKQIEEGLNTYSVQLEATAKDQGNTAQNDSASVIQVAQNFRKALKSDGSDPNRPIFLDPGGLQLHGVRSVPFSPVTLAQRKGKGVTVLLDPVTCKSLLFMEDVKEDIRNFANKLRHADPFEFGLLQCKSVLNGEVSVEKPEPSVDKSSLSFVFHIPDTHPQIESVRAHLLRGPRDKHHTFPQRLNLARQLVRAVHYVHMYKFVHKGIRPETILILTGADQKPRTPPPTIREKTLEDTAVLVGFDVLRNTGSERDTSCCRR
ncbi:hypothetical protein QQX98_001865 [Neonectria punicea]|uniref:Protein kinase domain-containing protein n=1 Tax=Neonectria punicea TaxID=979145 RepID=A0ABR1HMB7_9HYPO